MDSSTSLNLASASFIFGMGIVLWFIVILSFWQVFEKAGYAGWKSIVPIYNTYILSKIGNQDIWAFLLLFVPFLNIVGVFMISNGVAKAFGKSTMFAIFGLMIFSFFGYMYLGWGQSEFIGEKTASTE